MIVTMETRRNCVVYRNAVIDARSRIARDARQATGAVRKFLEVVALRFLEAGADVATIAREAGIHRNTLHPGFNRTFGTTPWRYIRDRRFDVAQVQLRDTGLPVWKIGCLVGYDDARTFSRAFQQVVGHPPSDGRRRL